MSYAFRCKNCQSLQPAEYAGPEARVPIKCPICRAGVSFSPDGIKTVDPDNWIVLAELPDKDLAPILKYHAIDASEIETHSPTSAPDPDHVPVMIAVEATSASDGAPSTKGANIETHSPTSAPDPDHVPVMIAVEATSASDGAPSTKGAN